MNRLHSEPFVVLDFETSGVSPGRGDRAIEIGAVLVDEGKIVDRFQSLMNPGFRIGSFIESYTGITNAMLETAPRNDEVMNEFADFISGGLPLVAHNASFDRRFLDHELGLLARTYEGVFGCSMLVARRVYPDAPNHKLGTLVEYKDIEHDGTFHRALADAEMTAQLWLAMLEDLHRAYGLGEIPFDVMCRLARVDKSSVASFLRTATT